MPWTANRRHEWERLRELGCDGVITDYPAEAVEWRRTELKIEDGKLRHRTMSSARVRSFNFQSSILQSVQFATLARISSQHGRGSHGP